MVSTVPFWVVVEVPAEDCLGPVLLVSVVCEDGVV